MATTEIERKFLVDTAPAAQDLGDGVRLRQGYLAEDGDVSVRVRITEAAAILTVKAGRGVARTEVETELSPDQAEALWPHTEGRRIEKVRYRIPLDGSTAELDIYEGTLTGLLTVEVEFSAIENADRFQPPDWFGLDVTNDGRWTNAALSRDGRPDHPTLTNPPL